jgi:DNA (cytosine-5)-methyltransferase 1
VMRPPVFRAFAPGEMVVDNFAGGGGASTGIEAALGRPVDIAINHDPEAIALHRANHPEARHFCENIWEVDPSEACAGRPVGLAWFSPDCAHFSRAKGGTPLKKEIRGLAWVVIRWAREVRPRVICLENVEEFTSWGPLRDDGRPDPGAAGATFREWLAQLSSLGYSIEFRSLVAADYGAPTTRRRFYLVARRDASAIAWPSASHGRGRPFAWRTAAEVIDWSIPCPSIFDRPRALAEATQRRIAEGIRRFVLAERPFLIPLTHQGDTRVHDLCDPMRTVTAAHRGEYALVAPYLVQRSWGERAGQRPRCMDIAKPIGTVVAGGTKHALVAAFLSKHYGGPNGHPAIGHAMDRTLGTITARDHHSLTTVQLELPGTDHREDVRAFLIKYYGATTGQAQQMSLPLHTVTSKARFGLVTVEGHCYQIADIGMRMLQPRELYAAQGFPATYVIDPTIDGEPLTKTAQIRMAGNSVCPPVASALVTANVCRSNADGVERAA